MPDNRNRKRPIQVKFFVNAAELELKKSEWLIWVWTTLVPIFATWLLEALAKIKKWTITQKRKAENLIISAISA